MGQGPKTIILAMSEDMGAGEKRKKQPQCSTVKLDFALQENASQGMGTTWVHCWLLQKPDASHPNSKWEISSKQMVFECAL